MHIVKYLVEDLHAIAQDSDSQGFTALHGACENGHLDVVKYLVEKCNCNVLAQSKVRHVSFTVYDMSDLSLSLSVSLSFSIDDPTISI